MKAKQTGGREESVLELPSSGTKAFEVLLLSPCWPLTVEIGGLLACKCFEKGASPRHQGPFPVQSSGYFCTRKKA